MPNLDPIIRASWEASTTRGRTREFDESLRERIVSWEYTDKSHGADEATLVLNNFDLTMHDHEALRTGNIIYIQWGYAQSMHPVRSFRISTITGWSTLNLKGKAEEASTLLGQQRTRTWEETTEFEVAEEIARSMGYIGSRYVNIEQGDIQINRHGITQAGETDMAFLLRLARNVGCTFYISGGVFHFHQRRLDREPLLEFTYWNSREGDIIGEPEVEIKVEGRPGQVTRRGRSIVEREDVEGTASNRTDTQRPVLGEECCMSSPESDFVNWEELEGPYTWQPEEQPSAEGVSSEFDELMTSLGVDMSTQGVAQSDVAPTTAETEEEATSQARQRFRSAERQAITMSLTFVGNPSIRADNTIRINGLGEKLSGNWYVDECVHSIGVNGYTTKCKLKRNATSRSGSSARGRRRAQQGVASTVTVADDLPMTYFDPWNIEGEENTEGPPMCEVDSVESTNEDGQTIMNFQDRTGENPEREMPDVWEEEEW